MSVRCPGCDTDVDFFTVRFDAAGKKLGELCRVCSRGGPRNVSGSGFPFKSTHIGDDGKAITVNSLHHLRKLESRFGVHSAAYNMDQRNFERG